MLPFLKRTHEASASTPVPAVERKPDEDQEYDVLESAMQDLGACLKSDDHTGAAQAFRAAFDLLEMQPHEEISHSKE